MNWHEVGQPLHRDADLDDASMPAVYAHGYQFGTAEQTFGPDPALPADEQQARPTSSCCRLTGVRPILPSLGPPDR